ncbi:NAD(P)-dependent oxidoreductase [Streptomyces sp. ST2-7A]|uniref:NAD-dependent epimerase/dehydratase family protein n=1 Tax=Streptomyces sp. ST2-7A TaxID=2907214 RepID=UPI001F478888|nr:NAD(P)-dependent oxidoreductase [Streptomyces sp. ST2-7A]MCE7082465.1 NAD(P)-dependent oxidoreductase [Streptomyces sp. ST2-7A]
MKRPRRAEGEPGDVSAVVLGATGFLGRHICSRLTAVGFRVHRISRNAGASAAGLVNEAVVEAEPDVVVNAAGCVWSGTDKEMEAANTRLVTELLPRLAELPHRTRLVQLGTVHEYGPVGPGMALTEQHPTHPDTVYGRTKLRAAQHVLRATGEELVEGVVLRVSNALGPGMPRGSLVGGIARRLGEHAAARDAASELVLRLSSVRAYRDFVDVRDVAGAATAAAVAPGEVVRGRIINVGSGRTVLVRQLVDRLIELSHVPCRVEAVDAVGGGAAQTRAAWQQMDISRSRELLGWQPAVGADASLRDLLAETMPRDVRRS